MSTVTEEPKRLLADIPYADAPKVCCVMLANGRPEMVARAVKAFQEQAYPKKSLLIYDTGENPVASSGGGLNISKFCDIGKGKSIGQLRNEANELAHRFGADIIAHWDSDDWSSPSRIWEQVTHLYSSAADAVGYYEMLFWDSTRCMIRVNPERRIAQESADDEPFRVSCEGTVESSGEAWLYSSPNHKSCLGTSLLYWSRVWKANPFPNAHTAEDHLWCLKRKVSAVSAGVHSPRMIASIHGANTCSKIIPRAKEWQRVPNSDNTCRRLMEL